MNGDSPEAKTLPVPGGRWSRLARLGSLATGVAGGMLAEGARQFAQGKRPSVSDMLLTPANARRVTNQLAQLRGAAMKVGQLLSMDAGDLLPPELGDILARLRADARPMPMSQLVTVLNANWGEGWDRHFRQFSFSPVAAASIGQVHLAQTIDGRHLAIKVQYPGVRQSIDSDIDNVASLLRISGLLPSGLDIEPLLQDAKRQLHAEADYLREGGWLSQYGRLLAEQPEYLLPEMHADLTTENVLAMCCMGGVPVESLIHSPQAERDRVVGLLITLLFREIFDFQLIQTDPNFANFRYDTATRQLILLDFGATRVYPAAIVDAYRRLLLGAMSGDRPAMSTAASDIGYFQGSIQEKHRQAILDIFAQACAPLSHAGEFDFGQTDLAARIRDAALVLSREKDLWHTPPADALFLHRKLGGLYLLAVKLKARVNVQSLVKGFL
ncbi:AarF/ABC1/UbiB kinase family protein [Propionivibrio sp.]|uniref:ABC1 kinase family protein n=1 Tax=Propionivibrio sp. TaxID=2212460 RepID=UPI0025D18D3C|nr:AarF/ABC1/UbiB kinase family protein [Propionivibrio sp.]